MGLAPPSYQAASYRQLWIIIAPYIHELDLYSVCLVSKQWHQIFSARLWGSPGTKFGWNNDTIYLSLTRFKRLLVKTRHEVRGLAHTLHIPPAQPEFYGGPQAGWLKDILDHLPSLQSLIVSNLSFFDHQCLQSTHTSTKIPPRSPTKYPLKLLIASECENTTAHSLALALAQFPNLIYLDISSAQGARSPNVLRQIGCLQDLKVLKLRNCGLRDEDLEHLKFTKNLRSLDMSHNFLTERGVSRLLEMIPSEILVPGRARSGTTNTTTPIHRPSIAADHSRIPADGLERSIVKRLTSSITDQMQLEEDLPSVFTNFHVASNYITIDGLSRIVQHPTFRHADCGSLNLSERPYEMLSPRSPASSISGSRRFSDPPEIEVLSPAVFCHSFHNLTSLRISHSVITSHPFSGKEIPFTEQCFELHSEDLRFELDSREVHGTCFEMEDTSKSITPEPEPELDLESEAEQKPLPDAMTEIEPVSPDAKTSEKVDEIEEAHASFESPEDVAIQLQMTLPIEIKGSGTKTSLQKSQSLSRKVVLPQISVSMQHTQAPTSHPVQLINSLPDGPETFRYNYTAGPESAWRALDQRAKPSSTRDLIEAITRRQHRIAARERHPGRFKPSMLPNLKTLTLTDVPSTTRRHHIPDTIILFIRECAEEEELARLEDFAHKDAMHCYPAITRPTLKLQSLNLEMTSCPEPMFTPLTPRRAPRSKRSSFTKSSTEDPDSELFINNSESDFSFFGEDDGGLLVSEGRVDRPVIGDEGLMLDVNDGHILDVVHELASYRKEKKRRFEALERRTGAEDEESEIIMEVALLGYWRGEVKVIR